MNEPVLSLPGCILLKGSSEPLPTALLLMTEAASRLNLLTQQAVDCDILIFQHAVDYGNLVF